MSASQVFAMLTVVSQAQYLCQHAFSVMTLVTQVQYPFHVSKPGLCYVDSGFTGTVPVSAGVTVVTQVQYPCQQARSLLCE